MLNFAFNLHYNIEVGPDDFWNLIIQGVSTHLYTIGNEQTDQDKKMIRVQMPDVYDFKPQDYKALFTSFYDQLSLDIKTKTPLKDLLATGIFSSSHKEDSVVGSVSAMHGFEKYYKFDGFTRCGIPFVYLQGNNKDWDNMVHGIERLENEPLLGELRDWLGIIKNHIITISQISRKDLGGEAFFKSMYKYNSKSGVNFISGWIADFFPYRNSDNLDEPVELADFSSGGLDHLSEDKIVSCLTSVPFTLTDDINSVVQSMRVYAGQVAFSYDAERKALVPERSFLVVKESEEMMPPSDPRLPSNHPKKKEIDLSDFLKNW